MNVLIDTGVWYAFCDPRERRDEREHIEELFEKLRLTNVLAPWPVIYETIRTRLARNRIALERLEVLLKNLRITFVEDASYREGALELVFESSVRKRPPRPLSMVDCVLRLMLDDVNMKIDRFVTFNAPDFSDVCGKRFIEIAQ